MKKWVVAILALVLLAAWYEFRPERLYINQRVNEPVPTTAGAPSAEAIEAGTFHSVAHSTQGTATIYNLGYGKRILRFTNFRTSNGPNVRVYLVAADDPKDNATVRRADYVDLGDMKGNIGDQNYAIGPDVDLSKYRSVSLWCKRFSINFGSAPLTHERAMSHR